MTDTMMKLCNGNVNRCPFDIDTVYEHARQAVDSQDSTKKYSTLGYVPLEEEEKGASITLARAYDDDIIGRLADFVGDKKNATKFRSRGQFYRNVWNDKSTAMCGRYSNKSFECPVFDFLPYPLTHLYTEGNIWQWRWFVPHDVQGLIELFGNKEKYIDMLTTFFEKSVSALFFF